MSIPGYVEYPSREFCKNIKCPVQLELNTKKTSSKEYGDIRKTCKNDCIKTAHQFHYWLMEKGYLIVRPKK
jgi:hypothetical protein